MATDWHFQHLGKFAVGGAGTVMTEALYVDPIGRNTYGDMGVWSDDHIGPLRRISDFLHSQGSVAAAQLHHSGPKAGRQRPWDGLGPLGEADAARGEPPWAPVSATSRSTTTGWHVPRRISVPEIGKLLKDYAAGARRCAEAGFDVLDIHAAHGYLIHSFLSPINNDREDGYGGDFAGRSRIALEIAEAVRSTWPSNKPLFFRLSCVDGIEGGWSIQDSIALAGLLRERGVDLIDCSSGGIRDPNSLQAYAAGRKRPPMQKGYQVGFAESIRRETGIPTMAVGLILDGPQAEAILASGQADLIAIGREALADPHWAVHAAQALGADPAWKLWPPSYGWWLQVREQVGIAD
jgi:2,4-dienoyl-CoA reductase-like NADH-dependent reductase (Old Yellow Enzyme family)